MSFTPPHTHWRGPDPIEWESMPQLDALLKGAATHDGGITRGERIAIVLAAIAMLLAAWWLH